MTWGRNGESMSICSGDAPINSWKNEEFGISHLSDGPGGAPSQLDSGKDHDEAWDPNAHNYIGSPGKALRLGFRGDDVKTGNWHVAWVFAWVSVTCEPIDPVVEVEEHVYKHKHPPKPQE